MPIFDLNFVENVLAIVYFESYAKMLLRVFLSSI